MRVEIASAGTVIIDDKEIGEIKRFLQSLTQRKELYGEVGQSSLGVYLYLYNR